MIEAVIQAVKIGGQILHSYFQKGKAEEIVYKKESDYVTEVDHRSQTAIMDFIQRNFPHHAILAEEKGGGIQGEEFRWIIDPLDGTTNFIHGFPVFGVSVAAEKYKSNAKGFGEIAVGAVLNPITNDLYYAEKGKGAFHNGKRITVSRRTELKDALLATGFPFREKEYLEEFLRIFRKMFHYCSDIRRAGAAALDLCWLASGTLDGFWEKGLSAWDMAAGSLIISEAGGIVTDFQGEAHYLESGNILAANPRLHKFMLELIAE